MMADSFHIRTIKFFLVQKLPNQKPNTFKTKTGFFNIIAKETWINIKEICKPKSKPTARVQMKFVFVPTCHLCGVISHFRSNCSLLRQKSKPMIKSTSTNTNISKFVPVYNFCGATSHIRPNCHKLEFKHFVFQSRICDDISPTISPDKLFHMLLKNLSLLASKRKLQDFGVS